MILPVLVTATLLLGCAGIAFIIMTDLKRIEAMGQYTSESFIAYRRHLPNLLRAMSRKGMPSPWPRRANGPSVYLFRRKLIRLLKSEQQTSPQVIGYHISFFLLLIQQRDMIDFIVNRTLAEMTFRLDQTTEFPKREHYLLLAKKAEIRQREIALTLRKKYGRDFARQADKVYLSLRQVQGLFHEHGFNVHEEFRQLDELQAACEPILRPSGPA